MIAAQTSNLVTSHDDMDVTKTLCLKKGKDARHFKILILLGGNKK
jgi:hypothetical protein